MKQQQRGVRAPHATTPRRGGVLAPRALPGARASRGTRHGDIGTALPPTGTAEHRDREAYESGWSLCILYKKIYDGAYTARADPRRSARGHDGRHAPYPNGPKGLASRRRVDHDFHEKEGGEYSHVEQADVGRLVKAIGRNTKTPDDNSPRYEWLGKLILRYNPHGGDICTLTTHTI